jgi:hypothetical protein
MGGGQHTGSVTRVVVPGASAVAAGGLLGGVMVGKEVVVAVSPPACSMVVPPCWSLQLPFATFPFESVLTSQKLSASAVRRATFAEWALGRRF